MSVACCQKSSMGILQNFIKHLDMLNSSMLTYTIFSSFKYISTLPCTCPEEMCTSSSGLIELDNVWSLILRFMIYTFNFFILQIHFQRLLSKSIDMKNKNLQDCEIRPVAISNVNHKVCWNHGISLLKSTSNLKLP